jgi:hypothetical protein
MRSLYIPAQAVDKSVPVSFIEKIYRRLSALQEPIIPL